MHEDDGRLWRLWRAVDLLNPLLPLLAGPAAALVAAALVALVAGSGPRRGGGGGEGVVDKAADVVVPEPGGLGWRVGGGVLVFVGARVSRMRACAVDCSIRCSSGAPTRHFTPHADRHPHSHSLHPAHPQHCVRQQPQHLGPCVEGQRQVDGGQMLVEVGHEGEAGGVAVL